MIKSMTGFGRGEYGDNKRNITAEIRSVNHRYNDITIKMPRRYQFAQDKLKKCIREYIRRGKVECSIQIESIGESDVKISLNRPVVEQYLQNLQTLKDEYSVEGELDLQLVANFPEVMKQIPEVDDEDEMTECLLSAVREASENIEKMRAVEGEKLAEDMLMRGELIKDLTSRIEERSDDVPKEYKEKLLARIDELMEGTGAEIAAERLAVEVAVFADKCSITEELIRLKSHMDQMKDIIEEDSEVKGKKLDFLVQEMNREANTIGSKANDLEITNLMLQIKAEVEKIREQVQNIE